MQQDMQRGGLRAAGLNSQDQSLSLFGPAVVSEDQSLPFLTLVGTCWLPWDDHVGHQPSSTSPLNSELTTSCLQSLVS